MHNTEVKILFALFVYVNIQSVCSYPQFSIPFVSRNNNWDNPPRFTVNIKVPNPFTKLFSGFGKDNRKNPISNEIVNSEKIITVTPNSEAIPANNIVSKEIIKTTQSPDVIETFGDRIHFPEDKDEQTESIVYDKNDERIHFEEDDVTKFNIEKLAKTDSYIEVTTDYTTETSTDYESTTNLDEDIFNRSGISSNVVASLLG